MSLTKNGSLIHLARDNFQTENSNHIKQLRSQEDFSDVTLITDDGQVKSHKIVLAAGSRFFHQLLGEVLREQRQPCIYLWGVKLKLLNHLLDFLYLGETVIPQENADHFIELSKQLGLTGLVREPSPGCENSNATEIETKPEINFEGKEMFAEDEKAKHGFYFTNVQAFEQMIAEKRLDTVTNLPESALKGKRTVARNFPCKDCPYRDRDRNGLRRHMEKKHTEGKFECKRVWCQVRLTTAHQLILHMAGCKWLCPALGCPRKGLSRTRDIQEHESFHNSQNKRGANSFLKLAK